jgi:hypothetical protein
LKPSTYEPLAVVQLTATTTTTATTTLHKQTAAVLIGVETNDARITFDGTTPASNNSLVFPKGNPPILVLLGNGAIITALSTTAGNAVVTILPLNG